LLLIFPQEKLLQISTLVIIVGSCSLDVLRWQPWEYQFLFFLLIFIINRNNAKTLYSAIIFVMASTYIYSGLHKINGGFLHSVWDFMILQEFLGVSAAKIMQFKLHYLGLAIPVIEALGGLGMLFVKRKLLPVSVLIAMHIFIIALLLSRGVAYVSVIPQWNTAMILFLLLFYYRESYQFTFSSIYAKKNKLVFLFWGVLPALSFVGLWDNYLSSSVYTGNMKHMDVCISNIAPVAQMQPYFVKKDRRNLCDGNARLKLYEWAIKETRVLPYPEDWYFKRFKAKYERMYPGTNATFIVYKYPFKDRKILK